MKDLFYFMTLVSIFNYFKIQSDIILEVLKDIKNCRCK